MTSKKLSSLILGTTLAAGVVTMSACESPVEELEQKRATQKASQMKCAAGKCAAGKCGTVKESNSSK